MSIKLYKFLLMAIAIIFTSIFCLIVVPPLLNNPDIIGALAAGFVNPYAAGYSSDVLLCWVTLLVWVVYDAQTYQIKKGWVCLLLGACPGVAVGFPLYLILREQQLKQQARNFPT